MWFVLPKSTISIKVSCKNSMKQKPSLLQSWQCNFLWKFWIFFHEAIKFDKQFHSFVKI